MIRISVCLSTYNGERFIIRQLSSILCQLRQDDEIIVSDDGSTDDTIRLIKELKDERIKIIKGAHRRSPIWNFENSLKHASGDVIFLADQDDEWLPNKVEVSLRYLDDYDCIVSDNITVDGTGSIIDKSFYHLNRMRTGKFYNLLLRNSYLGCCMAFNRKVLNSALPFPQHIPMHDIWIGNVAAFNYNLAFIPEKLIRFYRHGDNNSTTGKKSENTFVEMMKERLIMLYYVVKSLVK